MENQIILHIGLHKTATTYLQQTYFPSLQNVLNISGNFFIEWNNKQNHEYNKFLFSFESLSGSPWIKTKRGIKLNTIDWIKSFEFNILNLKKVFPNAVILIFFRKHGDLLVSLYKQYLNEGGTKRLEDFYGHDKIIKPTDLSFEHRINFLNNHFTKVFYLNYNEYRIHGEEYLIQFFKNELYIRSEKNYTLSEKKKNNISISGVKVELLRKSNCIFNKFPNIIKKIFFKLTLSPRQILQQNTKFWNPKENTRIIKFKSNINSQFDNDWENFEKVSWKFKA